jgi:hypothetical protein
LKKVGLNALKNLHSLSKYSANPMIACTCLPPVHVCSDVALNYTFQGMAQWHIGVPGHGAIVIPITDAEESSIRAEFLKCRFYRFGRQKIEISDINGLLIGPNV